MPNTSVLFKAIPSGPATLDTFEVSQDASFSFESQELPPNTILVETKYLSLDPYMRGRMRPAETKSYSAAFELGKPGQGHGTGIVKKSTSSKFKVGDEVLGFLPWNTYSAIPDYLVKPINTTTTKTFTHETWLGRLGMPSFTARTLFVSAAAGAVGQVVGQIGKRLGLRVVGSAGSDEKVSLLVDKLGFDAAFNYNTSNIKDKLVELCPNGIDIYFENVGGETLDAVLAVMNNHGRIPVCGMISQYNGAGDGIHNLIQIIGKRILLQGFIQSDWTTVSDGIESLPEAFLGMMAGKNIGKQLVKV
ncbi:NAD(P)-binding protein [Rhizoclosmatium globosum]|uniref:NAD(P)-binding protein n=1 Tax=Rhizoclosmatium globosum TaxID=329046 RepID=A0A1Y2BBU8_9FUNG|nr:NAD(P)-binding protein [Rhizoclosmatium globosum]|eukprot:ORY31565.1 NAD(P)-binding protein [Rhizoclosmatium globosum]